MARLRLGRAATRCRFCTEHVDHIDYKGAEGLRKLFSRDKVLVFLHLSSCINYPRLVQEQCKKDGALYTLNPYLLNDFQIRKKGILVPENEKARYLARKAFDNKLFEFEG